MGHCDPAGIVFNPRYFEFFDWSTALLVEAALGLPKAAMIAAHDLVGIPIVETGARFMAPSRYGDEVTIISTVTELKRSSFAIRHRLSRAERLCVEGHEVRVWAGRDPDDPTRLRSKTIPDEVRAMLEAARPDRAGATARPARRCRSGRSGRAAREGRAARLRRSGPRSRARTRVRGPAIEPRDPDRQRVQIRTGRPAERMIPQDGMVIGSVFQGERDGFGEGARF